METKGQYTVKGKENTYFFIKLLVSTLLYSLIFLSVAEIYKSEKPATAPLLIVYFYVILILAALFIRQGFLIGWLRGNAVKVSGFQFPDIHQIVNRHSKMLDLKRIPDVYILQSGGILNAFASRFMGNNYIIINSDVVDAAEQDKHLLSFIIGHELGHIKRNHMLKNLLLFPSWIVPFLGSAYSRACEYTCDSIGYSLSPIGSDNGLLLLAAGKTVYQKVNAAEYISQRYNESGFWTWFAEKVSSHPNLTKRLACFAELNAAAPKVEITSEPQVVEEKQETDYSRYMPQ
jgi:Zn-dependent protease with chaperone function